MVGKAATGGRAASPTTRIRLPLLFFLSDENRSQFVATRTQRENEYPGSKDHGKEALSCQRYQLVVSESRECPSGSQKKDCPEKGKDDKIHVSGTIERHTQKYGYE